MKHGKKYLESKKLIDSNKLYDPADAISLVKQTGKAKFDETVELSIRLGVDPRHADQQVRGAVVLPHGTGRVVRVLVFAKGEKAEEARAAGADYVGEAELVDKIRTENWFDFDVCVATPDMMGVVGKIAKILGPRGMMPNPKLGTVTMNIRDTVQELKKGKVEFKSDKAGIVHVPVGKVSFDAEKLYDNVTSVLDMVNRLKPPASKGQYLKNIVLSSTMGPGVRIDVQDARSVVG